jgi:hypothetical protein
MGHVLSARRVVLILPRNRRSVNCSWGLFLKGDSWSSVHTTKPKAKHKKVNQPQVFWILYREGISWKIIIQKISCQNPSTPQIYRFELHARFLNLTFGLEICRLRVTQNACFFVPFSFCSDVFPMLYSMCRCSFLISTPVASVYLLPILHTLF